jgi:hypothetical protein
MTPPRPPRGEVSNRGRASRKAAEKAWEQELGVADRRGAKRVKDRLLALRDEHAQVVDGIEYIEWSVLVAALEEEVSPPADPTTRPAASDEAGPAPIAT